MQFYLWLGPKPSPTLSDLFATQNPLDIPFFVLSIVSRGKENGVRLYHCPELTAYFLLCHLVLDVNYNLVSELRPRFFPRHSCLTSKSCSANLSATPSWSFDLQIGRVQPSTGEQSLPPSQKSPHRRVGMFHRKTKQMGLGAIKQ